MAALERFDITHLWTSEDDEAIVYLGYPLIQCRRQREAFTSHFLGQLRQTVDLHARRGISVYGRATIANSLILSRCWYVLGVLPSPLELLRQIRSIIASFVILNIHPNISWDLMVKPKLSGGLGIIYIYAQQKALYYRWLDPILFERPAAPAISAYIRVHLHNHMNTSILDMGLLFPAARSALVGAAANTTTMIFRTIDAIPRTFLPVDRNPIECLLLLIPAIIASASPGHKLSPRLKTATVGDIYELQGSGFYLTPIPGDRLPSHLKVVTRRFHLAVTRDHLHLQPFFRACLDRTSLSLYSQADRPHIQASLNFASFRRGLQIQPSDANFAYPQGRTRNFRQMILTATERMLPRTQSIAASAWKAFWALFLNHTQRNVLYRLIHHKIPSQLKRSLYNNSAIDPQCTICLTVVESTDHFFFYCEVKQHFWDRLIQEYLWPGTSLQLVLQSIRTLQFDRIPVRPEAATTFEPLVIIIVALAEVWKAHWRFTFDNVPVTTDTLYASFQRALQKHQAEDDLPPSLG